MQGETVAFTPTAYATPADYRAAFSGTETPWQSDGQDAPVAASLTVISRHIDSVLHRSFGKEETAVARVYIPRRLSSVLDVHDMSATPTVVKIDTDNDGVFTDEDALVGFEAWPFEAAYGAEPRPYYQVHLPIWATPTTAFVPGQRVEVTAKWGWAAVPEPIKEATVQLAGILRLQSPRATNRYSEDIGMVIGASRQARDIIDKLVEQYALKTVAGR